MRTRLSRTAPAPDPTTMPADEPRLGDFLRANKLGLIEKLADDLAHEIKNPLHAMSLHLEILRRRVGAAGEGKDDVSRYISRLNTDVDRASRNVDLLLSLTRASAAGQRAALNEIVPVALQLLRLEARRRSVTLRFRPGPSRGTPDGPPEATRLCILNLVAGVLEGAPEGARIALTASTRDGEGCLRVSAPSGGEDPLSQPRIAFAATIARDLGGTLSADTDAARVTLVLPASGNERLG